MGEDGVGDDDQHQSTDDFTSEVGGGMVDCAAGTKDTELGGGIGRNGPVRGKVQGHDG